MSKAIKPIFEGFSNLALSIIREQGHPVEAEAKRKLAICETCSLRENMRCGLCGCWLPSMVRSAKDCDAGKFDIEEDNNK